MPWRRRTWCCCWATPRWATCRRCWRCRCSSPSSRRSGRMYRDSEMAIWFASGVAAGALRAAGAAHGLAGAAGGGAAGAVRLALGQPAKRRPARPLPAALGPVARGARRVPDLARRQAGVLHRARQPRRRQRAQRLHPDQATARASRSRRLAAAASRAIGGERWLVLERGQRNETDSARRRQDAVELRELPRAGRRTRGAPRRASGRRKATRTHRPAAHSPRCATRANWSGASACCAARPTCCCWASAWPPPTRAAPATGTCCLRCSASSSTTTSST